MSGRSEAERLAYVNDALHSGLALEMFKDSGLTYSAVADFVGVSTPIAWRWLNGKVRPRHAHALLLSWLLETLQAQR